MTAWHGVLSPQAVLLSSPGCVQFGGLGSGIPWQPRPACLSAVGGRGRGRTWIWRRRTQPSLQPVAMVLSSTATIASTDAGCPAGPPDLGPVQCRRRAPWAGTYPLYKIIMR